MMKPYNALSDEEKLKLFQTAAPTSEQIKAWEELRGMFEPGPRNEEPAESLARRSMLAYGLNAGRKATPSSIAKAAKSEPKIGEKLLLINQWKDEKLRDDIVQALRHELDDSGTEGVRRDFAESTVFTIERELTGPLSTEKQARHEELHRRTQEHEVDAQTGRKVKAGGKKGHFGTYGDSDTKQARWQKWQAYIESRHKQFPTHSFNALTKAAAKEFKISQRTIYRHCENPANTK